MNKSLVAKDIISKGSKWLILLLVAFAPLVNAAKEQPAIDISIIDIDGQWQVEAKMQIQLSAVDFIKLLDSAPKNCSWMHNCKSVTLLKKSEENVREIQTRFDSPWPFSDRLMLTKSVIEYNQDHSEVAVYVSESGLLPSADELNNTVLVKNPKGTWRVSRVGEHYELSYIGSADADIAIPAFLLKHTLLSATQKTFENIYRLSLSKIKDAQ
ncbi:hypothetical protein [Brumicola nitratireducens]|uniref:START domain-containing protein n=1 Tax=Glaciecola nitratireducens (strain JCM 12485 / KCTC 12276 / FR1064) TaxID=1085623 RepID=G4QLB4_GLANF|nr:hypothetical protein [Glaciecola nitratireducens]AEP29781.1 hypothetical protein GNIT_1665 [Glaciecola nitratireducens FR1064]